MNVAPRYTAITVSKLPATLKMAVPGLGAVKRNHTVREYGAAVPQSLRSPASSVAPVVRALTVVPDVRGTASSVKSLAGLIHAMKSRFPSAGEQFLRQPT